MHRFAPIRFAAVAGLAFSASLPAQSPHPPQAKPSASTPASSTLPATPTATPEPPPVPLTPSQRSPQPAQVTYAEGTLSVAADNASLNQILRQIASNTGMKITGGVTDERVFGQYGPADPAQVLAALLDGTGSNMILVHHDGDASSELILTPRQGGPTPPNPNAAAFADRAEKQEATQFPQSERATPQRAPNGPPITPSGSDGTPAGASPTNSSQPDNNPNGVKTPQQIYEQLQRMRQQQQQQQQQTTQPQ
jgi:hypothetical protein